MAEKFREKNLAQVVLKKPHVTEKASDLAAQKNAYVFVVDERANKVEIKKAIESMYKVKPVRVNIINSPAKIVFSRGKQGLKSGYKKAIVYLKDGDKIELL